MAHTITLLFVILFWSSAASAYVGPGLGLGAGREVVRLAFVQSGGPRPPRPRAGSGDGAEARHV